MQAETTGQDLAEILRWPVFRQHLRIEDRMTAQLVPFELNAIQQRIDQHISEKTLANEPIRVIILKARRMGVSTFLQMRMFHRVCAQARFHTMTGAHEARSSTAIHKMVETAYANLPAVLKRQKASNLAGREIFFVEGAGMETFTAGTGEGAARGLGAFGLHCSEVAYWDNIAGVLLSLRQIIPDAPGTMIFLESTAHGLRNGFRDEWVRAVKGQSSYTPLFFAWFEFPDYALPLAYISEQRAEQIGLVDGRLDPEFWARLEYDDEALEEEEILRGIGISEEQLAWRRFTILDACGGSLDRFHQEYPATPEEAFLSSGRPYIPPNHQRMVARHIRKPLGIGDLHGIPLENGRIDFVPAARGPMKVWEVPRGDPYVVGADTAGGISDEEHEARESSDEGRELRDSCSFSVRNLRTGALAAQYSAVTDADTFGEILARAGWIYKDAEKLPSEIIVESNNMGVLTLSCLRDRWFYPRIYHRESLEYERRGQRGRTIGWHTSSANRGALLANWAAWLRDHPEHMPSADELDQIRTFVWKSDVRVEHETGAHDDIIFGDALALQLFRMRSYYVGELPKLTVGPSTVAELEEMLLKYSRGAQPARSVREQALGAGMRPRVRAPR
jgi:hypothetical protein